MRHWYYLLPATCPENRHLESHKESWYHLIMIVLTLIIAVILIIYVIYVLAEIYLLQ